MSKKWRTCPMQRDQIAPGMVVYTVPFEDYEDGDPQWARVNLWDYEDGTSELEGLDGDILWDSNVFDYPGRLLVRCDSDGNPVV